VLGAGSLTGPGVRGIGFAAGVGVLAEGNGGGNALQVNGPALFSRSGTVVLASGGEVGGGPRPLPGSS